MPVTPKRSISGSAHIWPERTAIPILSRIKARSSWCAPSTVKEKIGVSYECDVPFSSCVAHLHYVDYLKVFPYLDSSDDVPIVEIPLGVRNIFNRVWFSFPSNMYVNPTSLEMSLVAKPGFVATPYFYLPKNKCEELLDQTFTIMVEEFGHGKTRFNWDIKYTNNHRLIGDCSNSDYCVVGEEGND